MPEARDSCPPEFGLDVSSGGVCSVAANLDADAAGITVRLLFGVDDQVMSSAWRDGATDHLRWKFANLSLAAPTPIGVIPYQAVTRPDKRRAPGIAPRGSFLIE